MLSKDDAARLVEETLGVAPSVGVDYLDFWLFQVYLPLPDEEGLDPFFTVNKETGEVRDFSVIADGDPLDIEARFKAQANQNDSQEVRDGIP